MTFLITYRRRKNETITLEWVAPKGWKRDAIRDAFHAQYPAAEILTITEAPW
jgi:hypothetical protein